MSVLNKRKLSIPANRYLVWARAFAKGFGLSLKDYIKLYGYPGI